MVTINRIHDATTLIAKYARIDGIIGFCVDLGSTDLEAPLNDEKISILRSVSKRIAANQSLIVRTNTVSGTDVLAMKTMGVDAVLFGPAQANVDAQQTDALVALIDAMALPCMLQIDRAAHPSLTLERDVIALANRCSNLIGVTLCCDEHVLQYDQDYYALKQLDRPIAVLPSCDGTLFHNLNTGADGVISRMALIAPHEVVAMYKASIAGDFCEAQMLHNRLAPLNALLIDGNPDERQLTFQYCAKAQSVPAQFTNDQSAVSPSFAKRAKIDQVLHDIRLQTIA